MNLAIILGSTRQGRFGDEVATWVLQASGEHAEFRAEVLDLRDYPLPFYDEAISPSYNKGVYGNEVAAAWARKIEAADAFIILAPEYNHSFTAVLKNALDHAYSEWNNKPVGFVGYGGVAGARAVEQLRLVAIELQLAPIRNAVHIPVQVYSAVRGGGSFADFDYMVKGVGDLFSQLSWWSRALKSAREAAQTVAA